MKRIGYFAVLLVLVLLTSLSSCVVNKDRTRQASHYPKSGSNDWNLKQGGYAAVHSRPPIN